MGDTKRTRWELLTHRGTLITTAFLLAWGLLGVGVAEHGVSPGVAWFAGSGTILGVEAVGRHFIPEVSRP